MANFYLAGATPRQAHTKTVTSVQISGSATYKNSASATKNG